MNAALKRSTVATYALGVGPAILVGLPFSVYLPPFIAAGGVIPVALVGLIFSLSTLWDGIVDPLIGTMIDKRSKGATPHLHWMLIALLPLIPLLLIILFLGISSISGCFYPCCCSFIQRKACMMSRISLGARRYRAMPMIVRGFSATANLLPNGCWSSPLLRLRLRRL
jgi:Na+/melibiose symporter-like transporter